MYNPKDTETTGAIIGIVGGLCSSVLMNSISTNSIGLVGATAFTGACAALGHSLQRNYYHSQDDKKREERRLEVLKEQSKYVLAEERIVDEFRRVKIENNQRGIEYRIVERLSDDNSITAVYIPKFSQREPAIYVLNAKVDSEDVTVEGPLDSIEIQKGPRFIGTTGDRIETKKGKGIIGTIRRGETRLLLTDLVNENRMYGGIQSPEKHLAGELQKQYDQMPETEQGVLVFEMDSLQREGMITYLQQEQITPGKEFLCAGLNYITLNEVPIKPTIEELSQRVKGGWRVNIDTKCQAEE